MSNQLWNNGKCRCECKKHHICEKDCNCENAKYLASIMDDSVIKCDEVIEPNDEEIKTIPTNFNEKNITCKAQILLVFLLITIAFLTPVSVYCYLIEYQAKQKHCHFMTQNQNNFVLVV